MDSAEQRRCAAGKKLVDVDDGEQIVISGLAGQFPNSYDAQHFMENLFNKLNLCDEDERRFRHTNPEIPRNSGKVYEAEFYDLGFFGIHPKHADGMDPQARLVLERSFEAILDAGFNPRELENSNTGVYAGTCFSEIQKNLLFEKLVANNYAAMGTQKSTHSNIINYMLQLEGPSVTCDTACSSGMYAFEEAYRSIKNGYCERAIVSGCNMIFHPATTLQFMRLGVINLNDKCRPFDDAASGYTRSEGVVAIFLQRKKEARRIYAEEQGEYCWFNFFLNKEENASIYADQNGTVRLQLVVHSKTNVDGYKNDGITFPSAEMQKVLAYNLFEECNLDPASIGFVEAHGTGTHVGDIVELNVIESVYCENREGPLLIGSVKGNVGHGEPVAGLNSIAKIIFAMETGLIPPNVHYEKPRQGITGLVNGKLQVVTEATEWPAFSETAGLNCFGFGGANCIAILKRNSKQIQVQPDNLPRLVCFSGATEYAISFLQDKLKNNKINYELIRLLQETFKYQILNHRYRGYTIVSPAGELKRSCTYAPIARKDIILCIGAANKYNSSVLVELQEIPVFSDTVNKFNEVLKKNNINLILPLKSSKASVIDQLLSTLCIQIGIVNVLKAAEILPDKIIGSSIGDFTAAYFNGVLTLDEVVLCITTISNVILTNSNGNDLNVKILSELRKIINTGRHVNKSIKRLDNNFDYGTPEYFAFNIGNPKGTHQLDNTKALLVNVDFDCTSNKLQRLNLTSASMSVVDLLSNIGQLYELGYEPKLSNLYPQIEWPVSRGTPMLSPMIKWKHDRVHYLPFYMCGVSNLNCGEVSSLFDVKNSNVSYYKGHVIDGRVLFPATAYLVNVWKTLANFANIAMDTCTVQFENVRFHKATMFGNDDIVEFNISINKDGFFELSQSLVTVVSGCIRLVSNDVTFDVPDEPVDDGEKLLQKDVYKILRLRGYQYRDKFRAIQDFDGTVGTIEWTSNWVTFLDNMLQLCILKQTNAGLYIPTGIDKLVINAGGQMTYARDHECQSLKVFLNKEIKSIRTKFIELTGLNASPIVRKRQPVSPVLEIYKFIPNEAELWVQDSATVNVQIIIENKPLGSIKVVEFLEEDLPTLYSPSVLLALANLPVIQPTVMIVSPLTLEIDIKGITFSNGEIEMETGNYLFIGYNLLERPEVLAKALEVTVPEGYLISVEKLKTLEIPENLINLTKHAVGEYYVYLLKRKQESKKETAYVELTASDQMEWLQSIKDNLSQSKNVTICCVNQPLQGTLGLTNCIRREPGGDSVNCLHIEGVHDDFNPTDKFYADQLAKNMAVNVLKNNQWGTYRHLLLDKHSTALNKHCYANTLQTGDLSSLKWLEGSLKRSKDVIKVFCSSINFRDIMLATGKISMDVHEKLEEQCMLGFEFAGHDIDGRRVMGIVKGGATSTLVKSYENTLWDIPNEWTMQDAVTVPVVYSTVIAALIIRARIREGQSILIHAGTGGIGLAAINVALQYKLEIFCTVGTKEKREFLEQTYPQLKPQNIGNSRDTTFEQMIYRETNGRGVDVLLNSLAEEKLEASVRCLARGGTFLEIGKFDITKNNAIATEFAEKNAQFWGVMLDYLFETNEAVTNRIVQLLYDGIRQGYIKPLPHISFKMEQLEEAYRYMGAGKHIGKVLINMQEETCSLDEGYSSVPRVYFNPNASYIICGGLGGFGLELAGWLVSRGAKHIILTSRNGIKSSYQKHLVNKWTNYGIDVQIALHDIGTSEGCVDLLNFANGIAPVEGIFNLAVQLKDALFTNLSAEDFRISLKAKAVATKHLDKATRRLCPALKHFVVFSSVSCGRGNAGQSNYGYSNSIMERLCEKRREQGLPAVAIQWGAVGDVGLVAEMQREQNEIVIGGTLQQRISSCLEVMDYLLPQENPVVASMLVAEKSSLHMGETLLDTVLYLLGIRDIKTVNQHATFPELGMDSMMAVEIKQVMERDYDIFVSPQDMKTMTFARIIELEAESKNSSSLTTESRPSEKFEQLFINSFNEETRHLATLHFAGSATTGDKVVHAFPGLEGVSNKLESILQGLEHPSICHQYFAAVPGKGIPAIIESVYKEVKASMSARREFHMIAHSFGSVIALEVASRLETEGCIGNIVLLDGTPQFMQEVMATMLEVSSPAEFETKILFFMASSVTPTSELEKIQQLVITAPSFEERQKIMLDNLPNIDKTKGDTLVEISRYFFDVLDSLKSYAPTFAKLKSRVTLYKPKTPTIKNVPEDLYLSKYVSGDVNIKYFDGNHSTIIDNKDVLVDLNKLFE